MISASTSAADRDIEHHFRSITSSPPRQVGCNHAHPTREPARQRPKVRARNAQAVDEDDRLATARRAAHECRVRSTGVNVPINAAVNSWRRMQRHARRGSTDLLLIVHSDSNVALLGRSTPSAATEIAGCFARPDQRPYIPHARKRGAGREQAKRTQAAEDVRLITRRVISEARDDQITTIAQALAYSVFLAIPAVLLVVLGVSPSSRAPEDVQALIDRMQGVIPPEAASLLSESLNRSANSPGSGLLMTVVGVVLALWTIASAATTLMQGITTAFDREDRRGFLRRRLLVLVDRAMSVGGGGSCRGPPRIWALPREMAGRYNAQPGLVSWLWWTAQWPVLILALLAAFAVLLYLGPDVEQPSWKWVTPGAIVALVIWLVASGAFSLYASRFGSYEKTWGTLSAVVVMLIWLWLTNLALLFGAEINAEIERLALERAGSALTTSSVIVEMVTK